jgi:Sigma-70 region 2
VTEDVQVTPSMMLARSESPTPVDPYGSDGAPLAGGGQHPSVGSSSIDRHCQLLEALRRRGATAAECLVSTFGDRAYRLAIGITGGHQDAEEVVQDAFWSVIRKIEMFRGESAFGSWLYRIVANAAYQKLRGGSAA